MEQYLERLPEVLKKLHELASNVLCEADLDDMRDDVKKLIDIVAHELVLNNKKELKVEPYGALNNLFFAWNRYGATFGTWTRDLFITNEVLYHWAMAACYFKPKDRD